jgi:YHS domain-containing protein
MKGFLTVLLAASMMAACNNGDSSKSTKDTVKTSADMPATPPEENAPVTTGKDTTSAAGGFVQKMDPVCGMPFDTSFHEWAVYKKDTIRFCSPTCKRIYEKNPAKFVAKLGL